MHTIVGCSFGSASTFAINRCVSPTFSMTSPIPGAKRLKLTAFGRSAHVTARGLSALFNDIRTHGVPDATSRFSIMQARRREVFAQTPHGPLLRFVVAVHVNNNPIKVPLQVPAATLHLAA